MQRLFQYSISAISLLSPSLPKMSHFLSPPSAMKKRHRRKDESHSGHSHSPFSDSSGGTGDYHEGGQDKQHETNSHFDNADVLLNIDRFLSTVRGDGDSRCRDPPVIPGPAVDRLTSMVRREIARHESSDGGHDRWDPSLLDPIERLSSLSVSLSYLSMSQPSYGKTAQSASKALQQAMTFLEEEFRLLLEGSRTEPEDAEASTPYPSETVESLRRIAETMISAGYESECCQTFSIARRNAFDARLSDIGFAKLSTDEMHRMSWESLAAEVVKWIQAFRESVSFLLPRERVLCESVFAGHCEIAGSLFGNLARGVVIQLLNFAEAVATTDRSAEKLFKVLDMYETLRDMLSDMDILFPGEEEAADLKTEISATRSRLGEAAVAIFCELESSIKADTSRTPVPGGAVHPLTRYVMNYLEYACDYNASLEQVFVENRGNEGSTATEAITPFASELLAVMELLDSNLVTKSKVYKDPALSCIFLMNNGRYVAKKIKESADIFGLLGSGWYRKRSSVLQEYHKSYQRETWSKVLGCFREEGLHAKGGVSTPVIKERLKSFNAMVDEIRRTQSVWVVSDEQMQSELRVSISAVVVPAYRSFLGRYRQYLNSVKQPEKYVRFSPEDLETYIDELFVGNPSNHGRKRTL